MGLSQQPCFLLLKGFPEPVNYFQEKLTRAMPDRINCLSLEHSKEMHLLQAGVNLVREANVNQWHANIYNLVRNVDCVNSLH